MAKRAKAVASEVAATRVADGLENLASGMGGYADKGIYTRFYNIEYDAAQLEAAYRNDWIARKIIDIPAQDATREWRAWQADRDQITAIEDLEKQFGIQVKMKQALQKARLYGGGALILGVNQGQPEDELHVETLGKDALQFVHVVSRHELQTGPLNRNLLSPYYLQPEWYSAVGDNLVRIHPSRVVRFIGLDLPNQNTAGDPWGDPVLKVVQDAVKAAGRAANGIAQLIDEAKLDVVRIPQLTDKMVTTTYERKLQRRFAVANTMKSLYHLLLLDKDEEWSRVTVNFNTLPDILKMYLLIASGAADIPATRLLGQAPAGLNATGDSDVRNYYDRIASEQETIYSPALEKLDEVLVRSALGNKPEEIHYIWNSLWQMDDAQKADVALKKAQTYKIDVDAGLIEPAVLKVSRENQLIEDGTYPGLEGAIEEFGTDPADMDEQVQAVPPDEELEEQPPTEAEAQAERVRTTDARKVRRTRRTMRKAKGRMAYDAAPRTLYVYRSVLNWQAIAAHFKAQGLDTTVGAAMHVTLAYSRLPVDWMKAGEAWAQDDEGRITVKPGGVRMIEKLAGKATVLLFASSDLSCRWWHIKECTGAEWKWPEYQPHVTITYEGPDDVAQIQPWTGEIVLGPEVFEEINPDYADLLVEDAKAGRVFAPHAVPVRDSAVADQPAITIPVTVNMPAPAPGGKKVTRVTKRDTKGRIEETEEEVS